MDMNNEKAISILKSGMIVFNDEFKQAIEIAINELKNERWYDIPSNEMTLEEARSAVRDLRKRLVNVQLEERPYGKWEKPKNSLWTIAVCSVCGATSVEAHMAKYCPHCGSRMIKEKEA